MDFMTSPKQSSHFRRFPWLPLFSGLFLLAFLCFMLGKYIESLTFLGSVSILLFIFLGGFGFIISLLFLSELTGLLRQFSEKLDQGIEAQNRQQTLLLKISQGSRVSDRAKEIIFRDAEQIEIGEAVLGKLHQHDFESAQAMLDAMAGEPRYKELAARLSQMADRYRTATEEGRISQIIHHINGLMDKHLWTQAAAQIENLLTMFSFSEKAKQMPAKLQERKNLYKRTLLAEWDKAIRNKETDRSLEILKELDLYLTPAEALALQESASSVFKTKLHNLGVEFQMAVADKNWSKALHAGKQIVQGFPNSRMAEEIRSKMDILQERARQNPELSQNGIAKQ